MWHSGERWADEPCLWSPAGACTTFFLCERQTKAGWLETSRLPTWIKTALQVICSLLLCSFIILFHSRYTWPGLAILKVPSVPTWIFWDAGHIMGCFIENELALFTTPYGQKLCSIYVHLGQARREHVIRSTFFIWDQLLLAPQWRREPWLPLSSI